MRIVRGVDARWLPSRHNFALFRLLAWLRIARTPRRESATIFAIDRNQSAFETYATATWIVLTATCFSAAGLFSGLPLAAALGAGFPTAVLLIQVLIIIGTTIVHPLVRLIIGGRPRYAFRVNSVFVMLVLLAAAVHFLRSTSWVSLAAAQFLLLVGLNTLAALILIPLQPTIDRVEASFGGAASAD